MIRLTTGIGKPLYIAPENIIGVTENKGGETEIQFSDQNAYLVDESPEEVARKVLGYKLAMLNFNHDSVAPMAEAELLKLAGLED